ncbi:hypothetical protein B0J11DRAFT_149557 [Dendryphion nanum]|uniref:CCHC-type domain-containing protein n=1 Tax=Dendryphion nanum TaxID=256645 RepID=A0A9P9EAX8_9PLEO|nr:hypothetical protein B0J11DRAFT_149557 [Dendryphion nanum]
MASNTPKAMSSRLATMKFMQRSASKSVGSEPSTPNGPHSKRVRLSHGGSAPGTPTTPSDHEVLQAALAAEEKKREDAIARAAEKAGETRWFLSFQDPRDGARKPGMNVIQAGFATIDAESDDNDEDELKPGRIQFGGGVKREDTDGSSDDSDEPEDDSDTSEPDSDDPAAELIRQTQREYAAKTREAKKAHKKSLEDRPKPNSTLIDEDMDLGGLTSLSGGLNGGGRGTNNIECYSCGQKGHTRAQCPNPTRGSIGRGGRGGGRGRGGRR